MDIDEGLGLGDEELLWDISAFKSYPVFLDLGVKNGHKITITLFLKLKVTKNHDVHDKTMN